MNFLRSGTHSPLVMSKLLLMSMKIDLISPTGSLAAPISSGRMACVHPVFPRVIVI